MVTTYGYNVVFKVSLKHLCDKVTQKAPFERGVNFKA